MSKSTDQHAFYLQYNLRNHNVCDESGMNEIFNMQYVLTHVNQISMLA